MNLPYCTRCNQPRTPDQLRRGICGACRRHRCEKHQPGSEACYQRCGCRCDACGRDVYRRQQARIIRGVESGLVLIDATGTRRRIQSLMALGWTSDEIGVATGAMSGKHIQQTSYKARVRLDTARLIATAYRQLSATPGTSSQTRGRAERAGWPPPMAWDDGTGPHGIDNPQATPYTAKTSFRKAAEMVEELRHIIDTDTPDNIARRLGYANLQSLVKTLYRLGEDELARHIDERRAA